MTRAYLGLGALDFAYLATGWALLFGLGLVSTRRSALRLAGLAFTVGWASYGVAATFALTAGASLRPAVALGLCGLLGALGLLLARVRPWATPPSLQRPRRSRSWVGVLFGGLLVAYLGVLCARSVPGEADTNWDAWAFWLPKAKSLYYFHGLDNGPGGFTHFANRDYPPLGPALEATNFHFSGATFAAPLQFQHWLLAVGFFGALAGLLAERVRPAVLWPGLAAIALMPRFGFYAGSSLPDETLGVLAALAAVCAALWVLERSVGYAALLIIFVTAATLLKNEGLVYGLAIAIVVAAVAVRSGARSTAAAVVAIPILALVPWKLWLVNHGLPASSQYYNLSDLTPNHLVSASSRLGTSTLHLTWYLISPNRWLLAVPLAVAAAALVARRQPLLAVLTAAFVTLSMAGLLLIYWIGNIPIGWWLVTSGDRVVMSIAIGCAALFPLLVAEALPDDA